MCNPSLCIVKSLNGPGQKKVTNSAWQILVSIALHSVLSQKLNLQKANGRDNCIFEAQQRVCFVLTQHLLHADFGLADNWVLGDCVQGRSLLQQKRNLKSRRLISRDTHRGNLIAAIHDDKESLNRGIEKFEVMQVKTRLGQQK